MGIDVATYRARVGVFCFVLSSLAGGRLKPQSTGRPAGCRRTFAGRMSVLLLAIVLQAPVIAALLLIGGVEPNPGPDPKAEPNDQTPCMSSTAHSSTGHDSSGQKASQKNADPQHVIQMAMRSWRETIKIMYPDMGSRTYCVPPVYFNRVPYGRIKVAGQDALKLTEPTPPQEQHAASSSGKQKQKKPQTSKAEHGSSMPQTQRGSHNDRRQAAEGSASTTSSNEPYSMWPKLPQPHMPPANVQTTDLPDDAAQAHVLHCINALGDEQKEVMFVVSHSKFENYLDKVDEILRQMMKSEGVHKKKIIKSVLAAARLPRPRDLGPELQNGDFDILIIHRDFGLLVGEIKSRGANQNLDCDKVVQTVRHSLKQLEKSDKVIRHLISDFAPDLSIRKSMIMPSITSRNLTEALTSDQSLAEMVCRCLGAKDVKSAVELCLCADQLSDPQIPWEVKQALPALKSWWQKRMAYQTDPEMSEDVYLELVTRLAGPATTVEVHCVVPPRLEVRTEGEAVSEVGERIARLVLTEHQLEILYREDCSVCLTGAPGTGKTLMLTLKGLQWLYSEHDVHIVYIDCQGLPAASLIFHQLKMTLDSDTEIKTPGRPILHCFPMDTDDDLKNAIGALTATAKGGHLHVIMDEAHFVGIEDRSGPHTRQLVTTLKERIPNFTFWTSALYHKDVPDCLLKLQPLSVAFRCPPVVQDLVAKGVSFGVKQNLMPGYHAHPAASHGPKIILRHHRGTGHTGQWPVECVKCGQIVAETLHSLQVGRPASLGDKTAGNNETPNPPPLRYRDVLIITSSTGLQENCGFIQGLKKEGIPLCSIDVDFWQQQSMTLRERLTDFATAKSDHVVVTVSGAVRSMERKVVVHLEGRMQMDGSYAEKYNQMADIFDSFMDFSRCTSQLILVRGEHIALDTKKLQS